MKRKRNTTTESTFLGYPVLTDAERKLAIDTDIMQKFVNQLDRAEEDKSKVLFFRFDLHHPQGTQAPQGNDHFKRFISAYQKNLSRKGLSPQYFAVREQRRSENTHYHVISLLDGQRTQNCYGHIRTAERLWASELGIETDNPGSLGLVNHCDKDRKTGERMRNGMMLDPNRDDYEEVRATCIRRASYLAKEHQKNAPKGVREVFASRLPKDRPDKH